MVTNRDLVRAAANEKVEILFYKAIEKDGKQLLKPLSNISTSISLKMVRAILDDTIIHSFYETLSKNLIDRGVEPGTKVQLRAKFSPNHSIIDPQLTGTRVLCEVKV